jgi:hypothetical protein
MKQVRRSDVETWIKQMNANEGRHDVVGRERPVRDASWTPAAPGSPDSRA